MVNYNNYNTNNESAQIRKDYLDLNPSQKKFFTKNIPSGSREDLLNIIKESYTPITEKSLKNLKEQIKVAKDFTPSITRADDSKSKIKVFISAIRHFFDNVANVFSFLTANRVNKLINEVLLPSALETKLPKISEDDLKNLLLNTKVDNSGEKINLGKLLEENGYSKDILDLKLSSNISFKNVNLEGVTFSHCQFDWTSLNTANLDSITFNNCEILNLSLINTKISNCLFHNCEMREVMFTNATLENVVFVSCNIINSSFEDTTIKGCIFESVAMPATHFLEASVSNSVISHSNIENTVFFGTLENFNVDENTTKTAVITKPITALLINPEARGISTPKAHMKLDQSANVLPLRITMHSQKVKMEDVNREIDAALKDIGPYDPSKPPIPQRLLKHILESPVQNPNALIIMKKAEKLSSQINSIFLPGGEDVPPALYGKEKEDKTDWGNDYRRSILELGLISEAFNKGIPFMGVCRGFQMTNVFFGAQLIQHVEGHKKPQTFELNKPEKTGLYGNIMKSSIVGACFHHQGISIDTPATEQLETSVVYQGLVKGTELKNSGAAPMILLQFHPEFYKAPTSYSLRNDVIDTYLDFKLSNENEGFWRLLYDSSNSHRIKKTALQELTKIPPPIPEKIEARMSKIQEIESHRDQVLRSLMQQNISRQFSENVRRANILQSLTDQIDET